MHQSDRTGASHKHRFPRLDSEFVQSPYAACHRLDQRSHIEVQVVWEFENSPFRDIPAGDPEEFRKTPWGQVARPVHVAHGLAPRHAVMASMVGNVMVWEDSVTFVETVHPFTHSRNRPYCLVSQNRHGRCVFASYLLDVGSTKAARFHFHNESAWAWDGFLKLIQSRLR